mgnify:FL=1
MTEPLIFNTAEVARFSDAKMQKVNLHESPRMFCDVYCLKPGQEQKPHLHETEEKVYHVLTGSCRVILAGQTLPLEAGHTAIAPPGVMHGIRNDSDAPATVLVFMAPHPRLK